MNKVLIYVEGPSDKYAMSSLLDPLISEKLQAGILACCYYLNRFQSAQ
jgi:hypothetical protein